MFYIIGGAPRTGKTSLAKLLSEKLGVPWISTDTIESVILQYVSEKELSLLFPKSKIRKDTEHSNDTMYERYSSAEIVNAYLNQGKSLERALEAFLESEAQHDHSYILEGYHATPSLVAKLKDHFEIQSIFLGREDKEDIRESIITDKGSGNWVMGKTEKTETFDKITDMIAVFSEKIRQEAQNNNQQYYPMDGNLKDKLDNAATYFR